MLSIIFNLMLKLAELKKLFPERNKLSHKGDNGRVLVVGGSIDYYGAPIFSGLGSLYGGADLTYLAVPECNFDVSRSLYPDFVVKKYSGNYLNMNGFDMIMAMAQKCDVVVIGPGLGDREETLETVKNIVLKVGKTTILDTKAMQVLQMIDQIPLPQKIVITPHHLEFELLTGKSFKIQQGIEQKSAILRTVAADMNINILLKGPQDILVSERGEVQVNTNGNAGMTVGGSGDVLAGLVGGLISQKIEPYDACLIAVYALGKAGDKLFKEKGYFYSATDLANEIPYVLKDFVS